MNNAITVCILTISTLLVSCGQQNLDTVIVTADTPIEEKIQAEKICQPIIKYITCSLEKAPESSKKTFQKALNDMRRKLDNDKPSVVARDCDNMMKVLTEKADKAFKNGCFVESAYTKTDAPKEEVAPPAPVTPDTVPATPIVKK
jgi:hypothetical protein